MAQTPMYKINKQGRVLNPISERALIQRLNRDMRDEDSKIKKTRGMRAFATLGQFFILDITRNFISSYGYSLGDLEDMARKRELLAEYEKVDYGEDA